ncbi:hypothetical protein [Pseudomonas pergaminensis]|uniref:hypothetical protein n=1 Tax=Pseudomonas pergaminensis TaxID=2853159 RepID=UPI0034D4D5EF
MRAVIFFAAISPIILSGCTFFQQKLNELESNSIVGYAMPEGTLNKPVEKGAASSFLKVYEPRVANSDIKGEPFNTGDCIMIVMTGGYINQNYETWIERKLVGEDSTRNEISMTSQIYETASVIPLGGAAPGKQLTIHEASGQLKSRPLTADNLLIYGPRKYYGGPLDFKIYLSEKDHDELTKVKKDITEATKLVRDQIPDNKKTTFKDVLAASANGATLSLDTFGVVAIGAQAADLFAEAFYQLNEQDDVIMKANFGLSPIGSTTNAYQGFLREGYYPIARLSTKAAYPKNVKNMIFDPQRNELKMDNHHPTSITLLITKPKVCLP